MASVLRRGMVGFVDQGFSGLSNILMVLAVARGLSTRDFGAFALSYATLTFLLTLTRSFFGTQLTLSADRAAALPRARAALGAMLLLTPLVAAIVAVMGTAIGGTSKLGITVVVALAAPVVCLQDVFRYAAVALERPLAALVSDVTWTLLMAAAVSGLVRLHGLQSLALWLGAALLALAVIAVGLGITPDLAAGEQLLRERHAVAQSITLGAVAIASAGLLVSAAVTRLLGPAALGSLRGASALMGPLNVLFAFVTLNLTPLLARRNRARDTNFVLKVAAGVVCIVIAWVAILLSLPPNLGRHLLGNTWSGSRAVLPWTGLEYVSLGVGATAMLWLRVRHAATALLQRSVIYAIAVVVLGLSACALGSSATVVAAAGSVAGLVGAVTGWVQVARLRSKSVNEKQAHRR